VIFPHPSGHPACAKAAPDAQNLGLDAAQAAKAFDINNLTVVAKSQPDTDSSHLGDGWGGLGWMSKFFFGEMVPLFF
jgi:hypothetical protein